MSSAKAFEGAEAVRQAWKAGFAPDPALTASEWADRHRILSPRGPSEVGPYCTAWTRRFSMNDGATATVTYDCSARGRYLAITSCHVIEVLRPDLGCRVPA